MVPGGSGSFSLFAAPPRHIAFCVLRDTPYCIDFSEVLLRTHLPFLLLFVLPNSKKRNV